MPSIPVELEKAADPDRFGRYHLLRVLGTGGMGVVYLAFDPHLERRLALKVMHSASSMAIADDAGLSQELQSQMLEEGRALARLDHPNVVTIYDVGTHDGRVYLAMELVEGVTLDVWVARGRHGWREIVDVMLGAARGLSAAHRRGLVHRDFKPVNVIVDPRNHPVVLDFGVVGHFDPSAALKSIPTVETKGWTVGTPAYMPPEQLRGTSYDARVDQFALCVSLFEILYGVRPFADDRNHERIEVVASRSHVPRWLHSIILRGLAPEPEQRFPTMQALADALEAGCTRADARYRRLGPVLASLALATAAITVAATRMSHTPCPPAESAWRETWSTQSKQDIGRAFAATEISTAKTSWHIVSDKLDAYVEHWLQAQVANCEATRVLKRQTDLAMDLKMTCLNAQAERVRALMHEFATPDANVVHQAALAVADLPDIGACADEGTAAQTLRGSPDPDTRARAAKLHAHVARVEAQIKAGRQLQGIERAKHLEIQFARALAEFPESAAQLHYHVALAHRELGDADRALAHLRSALEAATRADDKSLAAWINVRMIFVAGYLKSDHAAGVALLTTAKARVEAAGSPPALLGALYFESALLYAMENDPLAYEATLRESLAAYELVYDDLHPDVVNVIHDLGVAQSFQHRPDRAIAYYEEALARQRRALGPQHPRLALTIFNLGSSLLNAQREAQALRAFETGLDICESAHGPGHLSCALLIQSIAQYQHGRGAYEDVIATLQPLADTQAKEGRRGRPEVHWAHVLMAAAWRALGRPHDALRAAQRGMELTNAETHVMPTTAIAALRELGLAHLSMDEPRRAIEYLESARTRTREPDPNLRLELPQINLDLARAHWALGDHLRTLELQRTALEQARVAAGSHSPVTAHFRLAIANTLIELEKLAEAQRILEPMLRDHASEQPRLTEYAHGRTWANLGRIALHRSDIDRARYCYEQSLESQVGADPATTAIARAGLAHIDYLEARDDTQRRSRARAGLLAASSEVPIDDHAARQHVSGLLDGLDTRP